MAHVNKRRTLLALEEIRGAEDMPMHNRYLMEDFRESLEALDDWLNGADAKFDDDNDIHVHALADIVMCCDKITAVQERLSL